VSSEASRLAGGRNFGFGRDVVKGDLQRNDAVSVTRLAIKRDSREDAMTPEEPNRHEQVAEAVHEHRPIKAELVRSGRRGVPVLVILVISTIAAAAGMFGLWALFHGGFASEKPNVGNDTADVRSFDGDAYKRPPTADAPTTATGDARPVPTGRAPNVNAPTVPSNTVQPSPGKPD
jgi:hypothetical protein